MIIYFFRIYNIDNNKSYIGCANNIIERLKQIKKEYLNFETNFPLYVDMQKYSLKKYKCEILNEVNSNENNAQEKINLLYAEYTQKYNSIFPNGYNKNEECKYILYTRKAKYIVSGFTSKPTMGERSVLQNDRAKFSWEKFKQEKPICGIYRIYNIYNNKSYIGQSKNIQNRWLSHYLHPVSDFDYILKNEGLENFEFEILEECSVDLLNEKEKYYIDKYNSYNKGYNKTKGGDYNRNYNLPTWKIL